MKSYLDQITKECGDSSCLNIYCRKIENNFDALKISKTLNLYGNVFFCKNLTLKSFLNTDKSTKDKTKSLVSCVDADNLLNKHPIIDIYFYTIQLSYFGIKSNHYKTKKLIEDEDHSSGMNQTTGNNLDELRKNCETDFIIPKAHPTLKSDKENKFDRAKFNLKEIKDVASENISNAPYKEDEIFRIKPYKKNKHHLCSIFNKDLSTTDIYFLVGVIQMLLLKFKGNPDINVSLIIIKLYILLIQQKTRNTFCNIDNSYFSEFLNMLDFLLNLMKNNKIKFHDTIKCNSCCYQKCLFDFSPAKQNLIDFFTIIKFKLECANLIDLAGNNEVNLYFEIFSRLNQMNSHSKFVNEDYFILEALFSRMNINQEIKNKRSGCKSPLNYDFCVPLNVKSSMLSFHNSALMKNSLQDAFFRSLFEGVVSPYLHISVHRENIYEETLKIFSKYNSNLSNSPKFERSLFIDELKKQFKVKFLGEEGIDSGGIKKEFFLLLSHQMECDLKSFRIANNRLWFKKGIDPVFYNTIGKIIGVALYNDVILSVQFPYLLFKKLLGIKLQFSDLEEIEPEIYKSLINMENLTSEQFDFIDQYFAIDLEINGNCTMFDLKANGSNIKVSEPNFPEFKLLYAQFLIEKSIFDEFEAFKKGFYSIIDFETIKHFNPKELEKIIMGSREFNCKELQLHTSYREFNSDDKIIEWFWDIFQGLDLHRSRKLLQFITGNDRLPVGGAKILNLVIMKNGCDTDRLPSSQTCFNTLLLPEYTSKTKLREKILKAIELTAGFYLL